MWNTINLICSSPRLIADRCRSEDNLVEFVQTAISLTLLCTATFGLVLGSQRGAEQAAMAAVKLPAVWLITLALCAPGFYAVSAAFGRGFRMRSLIALTVGATARSSIVLFALAPLLWFFSDIVSDDAMGYHQVMLTAACLYALAGAFGLTVIVRALPFDLRSWTVMAGFGLLFFSVAGQTAWSLRPFVGRPAEPAVPWLRSPEGTFAEALFETSRSARGVYSRSPD